MRALATWAHLVEGVGRQPLSRWLYRFRLTAVASGLLVAGGLWLVGHNAPAIGNPLYGLGLLVGAGYTVQWAAARRERGKDPASILAVFLLLSYGALLSAFWMIAFASPLDLSVIFEPAGQVIFWVVVSAPVVALLVLCIAISRRAKRLSAPRNQSPTSLTGDR